MLNLITVKLWDRPRASNRLMPNEFAIDSPQWLSLVRLSEPASRSIAPQRILDG